MTFATLSRAQAASINLARQHGDDDTRRMVKKEIFAAAKQAYGIPATTKLKCETADTTSADYLTLKDSSNNTPFTLGIASGLWVFSTPVPTVAKRWFRIEAHAVVDALTAYLENDVDYDDLDSAEHAPNYAKVYDHDDMATNEDGDVFIRLDADHFTEQ